jgi:hypothetical protein
VHGAGQGFPPLPVAEQPVLQQSVIFKEMLSEICRKGKQARQDK